MRVMCTIRTYAVVNVKMLENSVRDKAHGLHPCVNEKRTAVTPD